MMHAVGVWPGLARLPEAAQQVQREDGLPAGMGAPAIRALLGAGCEREVAGLHGVGPKALEVLRSALEARGLSFSRTSQG